MAEAALKLPVESAEDTKNRLFVTFPDYRRSHRCYASFYQNSLGKTDLRPVLPKDKRAEADLIHTTIWNEGTQQAICNSLYVDCDAHRCRSDLLLKGAVNEVKLRSFIDEELGESSRYLKLVRSRSGKGVHVWAFFPGFPIGEQSKDAMRLASKIQTALIKLLEAFGADPAAAGLERWGTNWTNPDRVIDKGISDWQEEVGKKKLPVLGSLYRSLKANDRTVEVFQTPLKRWYPDQRVSRKVTAFVAENLETLDRGADVVLSRKDLLSVLSVSKMTLPNLLSEPVGPSKTKLRGLMVMRDHELWGHYRVCAGEDFSRLRHLAVSHKDEKASKQQLVAGAESGQTIVMFQPTAQPEKVFDGERNYAIAQLYLKLKWHGCPLETAQKIVSAYVSKMPEAPASRNASRHTKLGENVYKRLKGNFGCKPGIAEDWLFSLLQNPCSSRDTDNCIKTPKRELLCGPSLLPRDEAVPASSGSDQRSPTLTLIQGGSGDLPPPTTEVADSNTAVKPQPVEVDPVLAFVAAFVPEAARGIKERKSGPQAPAKQVVKPTYVSLEQAAEEECARIDAELAARASQPASVKKPKRHQTVREKRRAEFSDRDPMDRLFACCLRSGIPKAGILQALEDAEPKILSARRRGQKLTFTGKLKRVLQAFSLMSDHMRTLSYYRLASMEDWK
ncbi:MAG: hypothetical protein ACOH5I_25880 [Oligoflexus sp.]